MHARDLGAVSVLTLAYRSPRPQLLSFQHQPGLHVHFRLAGTGRYRVNGSDTINGGRTQLQVFYARNSWTKEVFERGGSNSLSVLFSVPAIRTQGFLKDHDLGPLDTLSNGFVHLHRALGPELARELSQATQMCDDGVDGLLKQARLLKALAESFSAIRRIDDVVAGTYRVRRADRERIADVRIYLERTLDADHKVELLAQRANMSASRFKGVFRAVTGQPVRSWLRQRRMEKAAELLAQNVTVAEVATAVGYAHFGHFARVFRDTYGLNPGDYRCGTKGTDDAGSHNYDL